MFLQFCSIFGLIQALSLISYATSFYNVGQESKAAGPDVPQSTTQEPQSAGTMKYITKNSTSSTKIS